MPTKSWTDIGETTTVFRDRIDAYASLEDAVIAHGRQIGWALPNLDAETIPYIDYLPIGETSWSMLRLRLWRTDLREEPLAPPQLVFLDELGLRIPLWKIVEVFRSLDIDLLPKWYRKRHPHVFRRGPVPGVRSRWCYGHYHRHMRTTQERALNELELHDEELLEYGVRPRARRLNLPNAYDDVNRSRQGRSWKNFRRTQYKA